jgi:hypothetical protein
MTKQKATAEKKIWHEIVNEEFVLHAENMFKKGAWILPLRVFVNETTGEVKLFSRKALEQKSVPKL